MSDITILLINLDWHFLWRCSPDPSSGLWPNQSHRPSPASPHTPGRSSPPGLCGHTVGHTTCALVQVLETLTVMDEWWNDQWGTDGWSYVSGGEEVHGLRDLEGEAEEVMERQERRVAEEERLLLLVWKKTRGRVTEADRQKRRLTSDHTYRTIQMTTFNILRMNELL